MRRPLIALSLTLLCAALPASAQAAAGTFFPGQPVDAAGVVRLGDVDVSRDGTGLVAYLREDGLAVSRLVGGALQAPERIDGGVPGRVTEASVGAGDGGRAVVAFVAGGAVYATVRPASGAGWTAPQPFVPEGEDVSASMSTGGHAYVVWRSGGDLRAARMDRRENAFNGLPEALDVDPADDAGANGRPRVVTSADGSGLAVWGEAGRVVARRLYGLGVSRAPQELAAAGSDPDVAIEDDSSYAWAVFRTPQGTFARRQRGSGFDEPVAVGDATGPPRISMSGRGEGYATTGGGGTAAAAVLKDDKFFAPAVLGAAAGSGLAVPAAAEGGDGVVAWFAPDGSVHARAYDNIPTSRLATVAAPEVTLSDPALGLADVERGLEAAANRAGDTLVAWVQVDAAGTRRVVAGAFDRFPGSFRASTGTQWRRTAPLRWGESFELWGPVIYRVELDGQVIGETQGRGLDLPGPLPDGLHRWSVVAVDRRGQTQRAPARNLRIDALAPTLRPRITRRRGRRVEIRTRASDANPSGVRVSGLRQVTIEFGSRRNAVTLTRAPWEATRRMGRGTVRITATDRAGNVTTTTKRVGA